MEIDYIYVACSVMFLAIVVRLIARFDAHDWLGRDLRRGDLYSLVDVASGLRPDGLTRDQARRLEARGMIRTRRNGHFAATLKGRLALRLRHLTRQRSGIAA